MDDRSYADIAESHLNEATSEAVSRARASHKTVAGQIRADIVYIATDALAGIGYAILAVAEQLGGESRKKRPRAPLSPLGEPTDWDSPSPADE